VRPVRARLADGSQATYWYCRQTNTRLPDPTEPGFAAALAAARNTAAARYAEGTLGWLMDRWRASTAYAALAPRTKAARDRYLRAVEVPAWGCRQAAGLKRAELLDLRDAIAGQHGPGAANMFQVGLSAVLSWAVERGHLEYSCLARAKALPGGHFLAWTEAEAELAMRDFAEPARRAIVLAYHIGQRRGDLVTMTWGAFDGAAIWLQPEKTKRRREAKGLAPLRLPVSTALRAELEAWRAENKLRETPAATILTSARGLPWSREYLNLRIGAEVARLKLRPGLNLHGLRKLRATMLAERGATGKEINAAMGWETLSSQEEYTRGADQKSLAENAVAKLKPRPANGLANTGKRRRKAE